MNLDITVAKQLSKSRVNELRILYAKAETEKERQEILDPFLDEDNLLFTEAIIKRHNSHSHFTAPTEQAAPLFAHAPSEKPPYIQKLIDTGRINSEMTVLTSLADVAIFIRDSGINLKTNHLKQFKNPKTNKEYSSSSIRQAITAANTQ